MKIQLSDNFTYKKLLKFTFPSIIMMIFTSILLSGFNIFGSSFFTALNNGIVSAVISFLRTLLFQVLAVMILPIFLELDGIWLSVIAAELLSLIVVFMFIKKMQPKYKY